MKTMIEKFSGSLLSREHMKNVKGGANYNCICTSKQDGSFTGAFGFSATGFTETYNKMQSLSQVAQGCSGASVTCFNAEL